MKNVHEKPHLDTLGLNNMSGDSVIETLDFKVADLKKKLNKLRYETGKKTFKIESLMAKYGNELSRNKDLEKGKVIHEESDEGQRLR